jgi:hypothetical protein
MGFDDMVCEKFGDFKTAILYDFIHYFKVWNDGAKPDAYMIRDFLNMLDKIEDEILSKGEKLMFK